MVANRVKEPLTNDWRAVHTLHIDHLSRERKMTTTDIVEALNAYRGDNIWEDLIYTFSYDEAATVAIDPRALSDRFVADGVTYRNEQGTWQADVD